MLSYLQSVQGPTASFGTRQFPLGAGEHVISLFAQPDETTAGKQFGVNGRPGDIYTVPAGRKLTVYQMDFNGSSVTSPNPGTIILMDSDPEGTERTDVAAFYPDIKEYYPYEIAGTIYYTWVFSETNDINRPFVAGRQPRCRMGGTFGSPSLELFGIEGPA